MNNETMRVGQGRILGILKLAGFACAAVLAGNAHAALLAFDTGPLLVSYDAAALSNVGTPEVNGTEIVFNPGLYIEAPADEQYYYDAAYFSANLTVTANAGWQITGVSLTAYGNSYVGDDATLGITDSFSLTYYGASYYSGALSGDGAWSVDGSVQGVPPDFGFMGSLWISTQNHYSYEAIIGYEQEARYDYEYQQVIVGYEQIFDEEGNLVSELPIYEEQYVEIFLGYYDIPIYGTIYQTSGGSVSLDRIVMSFQVAPVPVPPALWCFGSALVLGAGRFVRRPITQA